MHSSKSSLLCKESGTELLYRCLRCMKATVAPSSPPASSSVFNWRSSTLRCSTTLAAAAPWRREGHSFRHQSSSTFGGPDGSGNFASDDSHDGLQSELAHALQHEGNLSMEASLAQPLEKADLQMSSGRVHLEKIDRPPGRFDLLTNSLIYRWQTTAGMARKVSGPMREWAAELKYRTGVHMEVEPTYPERLQMAEDGGYATADEVDITVYLFGSERGIFNCRQLMETALDEDPSYVRLGVFRKVPNSKEVEWLLLRRINRDLRPPDIPPISLKLPGKWTLLYERYKEAAIRTLWEETGITVDAANVFPTGRLQQLHPAYYWRVPVHYFVAEVPYDVEVLGPQVAQNSYMHHWDARLLRQSPDPVDRTWAQMADPETGCAWMKMPLIDELQRPLRGDDYMRIRYTPPPYSGLAEVVGLTTPDDAVDAAPAMRGNVAEKDDATSSDSDGNATVTRANESLDSSTGDKTTSPQAADTSTPKSD